MKRLFIDRVAEASRFTKKDTEIILNEFFRQVRIYCREAPVESRFTLAGFISFRIKERIKTNARNPKTNEPITLPPAKLVKTKITESFFNYVNADVVPEDIVVDEDEYDDAIEDK